MKISVKTFTKSHLIWPPQKVKQNINDHQTIYLFDLELFQIKWSPISSYFFYLLWSGYFVLFNRESYYYYVCIVYLKVIKLFFDICLQNFEFNLGFGVKTTNPKEAGELLMKREYPQILEAANKPHDAIFIPETYLYGKLAETVKYW